MPKQLLEKTAFPLGTHVVKTWWQIDFHPGEQGWKSINYIIIQRMSIRRHPYLVDRRVAGGGGGEGTRLSITCWSYKLHHTLTHHHQLNSYLPLYTKCQMSLIKEKFLLSPEIRIRIRICRIYIIEVWNVFLYILHWVKVLSSFQIYVT